MLKVQSSVLMDHVCSDCYLIDSCQSMSSFGHIKGAIIAKYSKLTDDDLPQIEGNYDKFLGKTQQWYGDKNEELLKWADHTHDRASRRTGLRNGCVDYGYLANGFT